MTKVVDREMKEICLHEMMGMHTRRIHGYDQHDDHLWRWLNHRLALDVDRRIKESQS